MGTALKVFFLMIFLTAAAYALGVRVHPEAISASGPSVQSLQLKGVELTFRNGERAAGRIVKEMPEGIIFNMDGAEINFTNDEIASRREITLPSSAPVQSWKQSLITYDPELSVLPLKKKTEQKPTFQASTLWGAKTRSAVPASSSGTSGQTKAAPGSVMDIYQKSMSPEKMQQWQDETIAALNANRNPFVDAARAAQEKRAVDTSKSEAKLKELQEQGY